MRTGQACRVFADPELGGGSRFFHRELRLFLIFYVDDFKLAGPAANLSAGWTLLRQRINIEDPGPVSHFLGCNHRTAQCRLSTGQMARVMVYDMENFMKSCVDAYRKIIPGGRSCGMLLLHSWMKDRLPREHSTNPSPGCNARTVLDAMKKRGICRWGR